MTTTRSREPSGVNPLRPPRAPEPLCLCLEDLDATSDAARFLRCVALPGRQPGLHLDAAGAVRWQEGEAGLELWVTGDDRLALLRPAGTPPAVLRREGRTLEVPQEKPVILVDRDELGIGSRRLRVHLHGSAASVAAPAPVAERAASSLARFGAAALALGTAVAGVTVTRPLEAAPPIEVRNQPPDVSPPPTKPTPKKPEKKKSEKKQPEKKQAAPK